MHCKIIMNEGKFYIKDLQSLNGTFVNGNKITIETEITSGDIIQIGGAKYRFENYEYD